ncbi:MAG: Na/Pi cotransporter family protein [Treponema sp.]|nr:Na/Pi cotransporter family protein [Treponema sp.]
MNIVKVILEIIGSLGFLMYGMKMMSDGIQKSAGESLQRALGLMTSNRFLAVFTGLVITMIIQSSSATTVMVVSFVNAGLLSLTQSVGVIFGANIGTTITAWIVALFGFKFHITAFAVPVFGIGYLLIFIKRLHKEDLGEALMGFGLLFLGLGMLSNTVSVDSKDMLFLTNLQKGGYGVIWLGVLIGLLLTMLIHSSSASTAIIITMAYNHLLTWEFSAAMVLGSNIGTTIDSVLASIGTKVNARRAALVHVLFNITGTLVAVFFLRPLLSLVDFIIPGPVESNITYHIAMLHTVFNVLATCAFLPFTKQIAHLTERIIKPRIDEEEDVYRLEFTETVGKENAAAYIIRAEKEISDMTEVVTSMFDRIQEGFSDRSPEFIEKNVDALTKKENYADQMHEQITRYLVNCTHLPMSDNQQNNINVMIQIVDNLESMTDDCFSVTMLLKKSIEKKMLFPQEDFDRLIPYVDLAREFLQFIQKNINTHLTSEEVQLAAEIEDQIDLFRKNLKKVARKRLESGADVKSELLYIDLVRQIEKIGDRAYNISFELGQTK